MIGFNLKSFNQIPLTHRPTTFVQAPLTHRPTTFVQAVDCGNPMTSKMVDFQFTIFEAFVLTF